MEVFSYLKIENSEAKDLLIISFVLALLFSISYFRFADYSESSFVFILMIFFIFLAILFSLRLIVMKLVGYRNAFEIRLRLTYFDRFWLHKWDRLSYYGKMSKGVPMYLISVFIYFLTLGLFIFPSMWNYKIKKIPHKFIGTQQLYEVDMLHMYNQDISGYRFSKALFAGFVFYFIFALFVKILFYSSELVSIFLFMIFWIAFVSLVPIIGTEGYELWARNNFAWISALTVMITSMITFLVFDSFLAIVFATIFISVVILFVVLWRQLVR